MHSPRDGVRANTFSLAATVKISALKNGVNNIFQNQFGISGLVES